MYKLKIKEIRLEKGWTIKELAEKSGVSRSFITELEEGLYTPTIQTLCRISKALNCCVIDLIDCKHDKCLKDTQ